MKLSLCLDAVLSVLSFAPLNYKGSAQDSSGALHTNVETFYNQHNPHDLTLPTSHKVKPSAIVHNR